MFAKGGLCNRRRNSKYEKQLRRKKLKLLFGALIA